MLRILINGQRWTKIILVFLGGKRDTTIVWSLRVMGIATSRFLRSSGIARSLSCFQKCGHLVVNSRLDLRIEINLITSQTHTLCPPRSRSRRTPVASSHDPRRVSVLRMGMLLVLRNSS